MLGGQDKGIAAAVGDAVLLTCLKAIRVRKDYTCFSFPFLICLGSKLTDSVSAARGSLPASAGSVEGEFGGEKLEIVRRGR